MKSATQAFFGTSPRSASARPITATTATSMSASASRFGRMSSSKFRLASVPGVNAIMCFAPRTRSHRVGCENEVLPAGSAPAWRTPEGRSLRAYPSAGMDSWMYRSRIVTKPSKTKGAGVRAPAMRSVSESGGCCRRRRTWQGLLPEKSLGFQLGLKLPTGDFAGPNAQGTGVTGRHPTPFGSGPLSRNPSPDNLADTSRQPGTGSTDLIVGAFHHRPVNDEVEAFGSFQYLAAIANRLHQAGQEFRPGNSAPSARRGDSRRSRGRSFRSDSRRQSRTSGSRRC